MEHNHLEEIKKLLLEKMERAHNNPTICDNCNKTHLSKCVTAALANIMQRNRKTGEMESVLDFKNPPVFNFCNKQCGEEFFSKENNERFAEVDSNNTTIRKEKIVN